MFNLQAEMAKAFIIALEGEMKFVETTQTRYVITDFITSVSCNKFIFKGTYQGTPPRKWSLISPVNDGDYRLKVENVDGEKVTLSSSTNSILRDTLFEDTMYDANFLKMASSTKELGSSQSIHARVLLGNALIPPPLEIEKIKLYNPNLNEYQLKGVISGLSNRLSLIQGPPGTGKTMVSAELALQHLLKGRRVLLVAKTNKAVDMIISVLINHILTTDAPKELLKNILRLGNEEKISHKLQDYTLQHRVQQHSRYSELRVLEEEKSGCFSKLDITQNDIKEIDNFINSKPTLAILRVPIAELRKGILVSSSKIKEKEIMDLNTSYYMIAREIAKEVIRSMPIIVTTAYQCPRSELNGIQFDALIFDEASQATVPEAAMAIVKLNPDGFFTLIGDHKQLGPVVMSKHKMLELSVYELFRKRIIDQKLDTFSSEGVMNILKRQYRMHPDIANVCRRLSYPDGLEDHHMDRMFQIDTSNLNNSWQDKAIDPGKAVVFVSTENISSQEKKTEKGSFINMKNVDVIESLINRFIELGISLDKISTITSYKGQQELLRNRMISCSIGTVDSFQGDENEVVIFDITRDNTEGRIGFMNRPNRLNVAASRARLKLIVVGNHYNLKKYVTDSVFKTFLNEVSRNVVVVPSG